MRGGPKWEETHIVKDARQAYEQTWRGYAIACLAWAICWVVLKSGERAVTVNREDPSRSFIGGLPGRVLDMSVDKVCLWRDEILAMFSTGTCICLIRVGSMALLSKCVTMCN